MRTRDFLALWMTCTVWQAVIALTATSIAARACSRPAGGSLFMSGPAWELPAVLCAGYSSPLVGLGWALLIRDRLLKPRFGCGRCEHCGYDLTGNTSGRCPECGDVCIAGVPRAPSKQPQVPLGS